MQKKKSCAYITMGTKIDSYVRDSYGSSKGMSTVNSNNGRNSKSPLIFKCPFAKCFFRSVTG